MPPAPAAETLSSWLSVFFYLIGGATAVVVLYKHLRKAPSQQMEITRQPLEVRGHVEYTPIAVHREFAKEVNERFSSMSKASSEGRQKIYDLIRAENTSMQNRFTELVGLVREIKGKIERNTNNPHGG